jgi:hypothetical protein
MFKNHFIAGLSTTDKNFPIKLWVHLLEQAQITLNILEQSRLHPQLLAHEVPFGQCDFKQTPLAPPGTRAIVYEKLQQQGSWAPHVVDAWLHSINQFYSYTIEIFPATVPFPQISSANNAFRAATKLIGALKNEHKLQIEYKLHF